MVLLVHGAVVGGAGQGPRERVAGGPRHVPRVPRALLPARRVPRRQRGPAALRALVQHLPRLAQG